MFCLEIRFISTRCPNSRTTALCPKIARSTPLTFSCFAYLPYHNWLYCLCPSNRHKSTAICCPYRVGTPARSTDPCTPSRTVPAYFARPKCVLCFCDFSPDHDSCASCASFARLKKSLLESFINACSSFHLSVDNLMFLAQNG